MNQSQKINVLCIWQPNERLSNYLLEGLKEYSNVNLIFPPDTNNETFLGMVEKYNPEIIMGWRPTKELLDRAKNLELFINPGAGVQHLIPLFSEIKKEREIVLVNGHGNAYFTGQHAVSLLLALTNKILLHDKWMREGFWRRGDSFASSLPLRGLNIGLLGYGAVNRQVHQFLSGFDVKFSVCKNDWSKNMDETPTLVQKYSTKDLHTFLADVDVLVVAVPLTSKTEGMIGEDELKVLGKDGLLVNMARGPVIDEKSLYQALKNGTIGGAAIDVWYNYQPEPDVDGKKFPSDYAFYELDNVVLSPHRGASPMNDLQRWNEQIENISRFARGEKAFLNEVNIDEGY